MILGQKVESSPNYLRNGKYWINRWSCVVYSVVQLGLGQNNWVQEKQGWDVENELYTFLFLWFCETKDEG